jgi:hypothetical protein
VLDEVRTYTRFLGALRRHLRDPLSGDDCRRGVAELLARREEAFLGILERGVFANRASPYPSLFRAAGIELGDAVALVREEGVEPALARFYDAGVRVQLEEFKSSRPEEFDNPLLKRHYELRSGASRSAGRRTHLDLDLLTDDAAHQWLLQDAHGVAGRPWAVWHAVPPAGPGVKTCLIMAKLGNPVRRWFTPIEPRARRGTMRFAAFTSSTVALSRLWGGPVPAPEYVPPAHAALVAHWLAEQRAAGAPGALSTSVSLAVRVALAAGKEGLDIEGSFFRLHSEPYTPAKATIIASTGSTAAIGYAMSELGTVGLGCAAGSEVDDVHVLSDKVAVLQRRRTVGTSGASVGALLLTTLLPSCPKLMINVDVGDYARMDERACGCPLDAAGLTLHLSGIRSYDKLTSEGNTFLGGDLITLLEDTLPQRFGGAATDYQLVEEEQDGLTKVSLLVSPQVGPVDEEEVVGAVLEQLLANPDTRLMADVWREGDSLRVVRRPPHITSASKLLPLHVPRP